MFHKSHMPLCFSASQISLPVAVKFGFICICIICKLKFVLEVIFIGVCAVFRCSIKIQSMMSSCIVSNIVSSMVSNPLCDVTDTMSVIYARSAAHLGRRGVIMSYMQRELMNSALVQHGTSGVKSDTAVYTADGCSLVQRSPML